MITLRSLGGGALSCVSGDVTLQVFSPEGKGREGIITLLATPEEEAPASVLSWPGEYDLRGIAIRGIGRSEGKQVSYVAVVEGMRFGFLSSPLGSWSEEEIGRLGDLDILAIPAEDPAHVTAILEEVDPRVLIPLPTKDLKSFEAVLHAAGAADAEPQKEVKIKAGGLPADSRVVYVLKPEGK